MFNPDTWLDGSKYQVRPDFVKVKESGVDGVVWNLGDPALVEVAKDAVDAGLTLTFYYFLNAGDDPSAAATYALERAKYSGQPYIFIALDVEVGSGDQTQRILTFLRQLKSQDSSHQQWCYSGNWYIGGHIDANNAELGSYPLWDAAYVSSEPNAPLPWHYISMWQYGQSNVPGISGAVDVNKMYVALTGFSRLPYNPPAPVEPGTMNLQEVSASVDMAYKLRAIKQAMDSGTKIDPNNWKVDVTDNVDFNNQVNAVMSNRADIHTIVNNITDSV